MAMESMSSSLTAAAAARQDGDRDRAHDAEREEPELCAHADEHCARRAREPDDRKRVAGEALPPRHHEPTDETCRDGHDRGGPKRIDHERELEELANVLHDIPRELRVFREGDHVCWWRSA